MSTTAEQRAKRAAYMRDWNARNPEKVKASRAKKYAATREQAKADAKAWRDANLDKARATKAAHYAANTERVRAANTRWLRENPAKVREYSHRRRVAEANRTVSWDAELTELVTKEAADLACLRAIHTGMKWHVDHVVPLRGRKVSGLHVWNNLAVIPATANLTKSNRFNA